MTWIGALFLLGFIFLIFPELLILPIVVLFLTFEFILRLFGRSFDDEIIDGATNGMIKKTKKKVKKKETITLS